MVWRVRREVRRKSPPGYIDIAVAVERERHGPIQLAATEIGRIDQHWVNHQRAVPIIRAQLEADLLMLFQNIIALDLFFRALVKLINERFGPHQRRASKFDDEPAGCVQLQFVRPFKMKPNALRSSPGPKHEVKFQLPLLSVVDQIDSGIDLPVNDLAKGLNASLPPP